MSAMKLFALLTVVHMIDATEEHRERDLDGAEQLGESSLYVCQI